VTESTRTSKSILLVDDEPFILSATAQLLRNAGHSVHTCEDWADVVHAIRVEEPDLILLDYNMPSLKGDELCSILKRHATNPDLKIVMFSSEPEDVLREMVKTCGADGYIKKDMPRDGLLARVEKALGLPGTTAM